MDKNLVIRFLLKSTIPGIELTDNMERLELDPQKFQVNVEKVVNRAHRDVLTGRFHLKTYCKKKNDDKNMVAKRLEELIIKGESALTSKYLIDQLCAEYSDVKIGAIQKLVNMALKYIIVVNTLTSGEFVNVDESGCDCPLDSRILESLKAKTKKTYTPWTQLENKGEYEKIQKDIRTLNGKNQSGIVFDFINW